MKVIKLSLFLTIFLSLAAQQASARPIRSLIPSEPSVELNLSVLSDLKPEPRHIEREPKKVVIKKKKLEPIAGTENTPKIAPKIATAPKEIPKSEELPWVKSTPKIVEPPAPKPIEKAPTKELKFENPEVKKQTSDRRKPDENPIVENISQPKPPILPPPVNLIPQKPIEKSAEKPIVKSPDLPIAPPAPAPAPALPPAVTPALPTTPPALPEAPKLPPSSVTSLKVPELPKTPPVPKIEEVSEKLPAVKSPEIKAPDIKVPELPKAPPAPASVVRTVQLPALPLEDETKKTTPAQKTSALPPMSSLFPDVPKNPPIIELPDVPAKPAAPPLTPPPLTVTNNNRKTPEPTVGKPSQSSVVVEAPKLPPTLASSAGTPNLSIPLTAVETILPVSREADVAAIAEKAKADPKIIVTIKSYAGGTEDQALQAKRTSLTRAISVRDYLLKTGVKSDQISVRPMGNKNEAGVPDRIDIFLESGANQRG